MKPEINILQGDNRVVMKSFADDSFHAIVTDPPYELGFMSKKWDSSGIAYDQAVWSEALRVLKPGGYLLAFGGSRTYHRLACAIEDAGFEIRDMIEWIYGSGFPKSLDVSKAMDRQAAGGIERNTAPHKRVNRKNFRFEGHNTPALPPQSELATIWSGWGTALKPAHEPICVARKPLIGTVVENVLAHGTGAINIDACRIGNETIKTCGEKKSASFSSVGSGSGFNGVAESSHKGRFPANLIFDEAATKMLDEQSGQLTSGQPAGYKRAANQIFGKYQNTDFPLTGFGDSGGASRFFYTAKASGSDRGNNVKAAMPLFGVDEEEFRNTHPTVKPLALMTYLLKLVCPPCARVLDPFCGSGTTVIACKQLGIDCTGIELMEEYVAIIKERLR